MTFSTFGKAEAREGAPSSHIGPFSVTLAASQSDAATVIVRLTSAVIVGGIHRNAGEEVKVDSALGDSLVRRQLAEPITSKPTQASSPAQQPTLDLDPPAPSASPLPPAPAPTPASDPVLNDETDETEREQETEPSDTVEPRESETESPGEPATVPEGDISSSPSRKRRRR